MLRCKAKTTHGVFGVKKITHAHRSQPMINKTVVRFVALLCQKEKSFLVARVKFQFFFSGFFCFFLFVTYINDVRSNQKY